MAFDSEISLEELEDSDWDGAVSSSILIRAQRTAETIDWDAIPEDQLLLGPELLAFVKEDKVELPKLELEPVKPPVCKKPRRGPLADATSRFGNSSAVTDDNKLATISKGFVPDTTKSNTSWALRTFHSWHEWRNGIHPDDEVPEDVLTCGDAATLNRWLSLFVIEARKKDGSRYPFKTIDLLLAGLRRHMNETDPSLPNFFDEKDPNFSGLRGARDTVSRQLRQDGIGTAVKHADVLSYEEEALLWNKGLLGTDSPRALFNAVFFMNGKVLCLRGGREHKALKMAQFSFGHEGGRELVVYAEHGSKNRSGSYKDKSENKIVKHFADPSLNERCYVSLLKTYFEKLSPEVKDIENADFYWKPKGSLPLEAGVCWYTIQPCGRNFLAGVVKTVCEKANIQGKTNHSLRATGATRLFAANVPEKLIADRTGHKSTTALRMYERTSIHQQQSVSDIIASTTKKAFGAPNKDCDASEPQGKNSQAVSFKSCENCTFNFQFKFGN